MQIKIIFFEHFLSFCIGIVNRNIQFGVYRHSETRFTRAEENLEESMIKPRGKYDKSTRKTMTVFRKRQGETARNAVSTRGAKEEVRLKHAGGEHTTCSILHPFCAPSGQIVRGKPRWQDPQSNTLPNATRRVSSTPREQSGYTKRIPSS